MGQQDLLPLVLQRPSEGQDTSRYSSSTTPPEDPDESLTDGSSGEGEWQRQGCH